MSEVPPIPSEDESVPFWTKKRIGLVALATVLIGLLIFVVLISLFGPTICCGVFPNIVNSL